MKSPAPRIPPRPPTPRWAGSREGRPAARGGAGRCALRAPRPPSRRPGVSGAPGTASPRSDLIYGPVHVRHRADAFTYARAEIPRTPLDSAGRDRGGDRHPDGHERLPARHGAARGGAARAARRGRRRRSRRAARTRGRRARSRSASPSSPGRSAGPGFLADRDGDDLRARRARRDALPAGVTVIDDRRTGARPASRSATRSTRSSSTSRLASAASRPADVGSVGAGASW